MSGWIMHNMGGMHGLKSWQWLFLLEGTPAIVAGIIAFFYLDDKPEHARWLTSAEKEIVLMNIAADDKPKTSAGHGRDLLSAIKNPKLYVAAFGYFVIPWAGSVLNFWSPTIIKNSGVSNVWHIGILSAVPYIIGAVGMLAFCWHSDTKLERRWHFFTASIITAIGVTAIGRFSAEWIPSIVFLSIMAIGYLSITALFWTIPPAFLSGTAAAGGIALISSLGQVGGLIAPSVIGWVSSSTGSFSWGLYTVAVALLAGGITIMLGIPKSLLREQKVD